MCLCASEEGEKRDIYYASPVSRAPCQTRYKCYLIYTGVSEPNGARVLQPAVSEDSNTPLGEPKVSERLPNSLSVCEKQEDEDFPVGKILKSSPKPALCFQAAKARAPSLHPRRPEQQVPLTPSQTRSSSDSLAHYFCANSG